jgi:hypothetical protein
MSDSQDRCDRRSRIQSPVMIEVASAADDGHVTRIPGKRHAEWVSLSLQVLGDKSLIGRSVSQSSQQYVSRCGLADLHAGNLTKRERQDTAAA